VDHLEGVLFLDRVHDRSQIHWVEPRDESGTSPEGEAVPEGGAPVMRRGSAGQRQKEAEL
jgi:hypothetical protein